MVCCSRCDQVACRSCLKRLLGRKELNSGKLSFSNVNCDVNLYIPLYPPKLNQEINLWFLATYYTYLQRPLHFTKHTFLHPHSLRQGLAMSDLQSSTNVILYHRFSWCICRSQVKVGFLFLLPDRRSVPTSSLGFCLLNVHDVKQFLQWFCQLYHRLQLTAVRDRRTEF